MEILTRILKKKNDATTYAGRFEMVQLSILENLKRVFRSPVSIGAVVKSCDEYLPACLMLYALWISAFVKFQ